jgi:hypothetical protein
MLYTCAHAIALWLTMLASLAGWGVDLATLHGPPPGELPWIWALSCVAGALACARVRRSTIVPLLCVAALAGALIAPSLRPLWAGIQSPEYLQSRALAMIPAALLLRSALRAANPAQALRVAALAWLGAGAHTLLCLHRSSTPDTIGYAALITTGLAALPVLAWRRPPSDEETHKALLRRALLGAACAVCLLVPAISAQALDQDAPEALLAASAFYREPAFLLAHQLQQALRELTAGTTSLLLADWLTQLAPLRPPRYARAVATTMAMMAPLLALALAWARAVEVTLIRAPGALTARRAVWASVGGLALASLALLWLLPHEPIMRPHTAIALRWGLAALPWLAAALCSAHILLSLEAPLRVVLAPLLCWGAALPLGMASTLPAPRVALVIVAAASALTTWLALRQRAQVEP